MKRILINATQKEELRIALVNGQKLFDIKIENTKYKTKKYNIYKGIISRIEPSLEAVFIYYGSKKHGFLPIKEINEDYFNKKDKDIYKQLYKGKELIVQINKDERNNKGASLTTFITLVGSNIILLINKKKPHGISKKIDGKKRIIIKSIISKLDIPNNISIIIRTNGIGKSIEKIQKDINNKINKWEKIKKYAYKKKPPHLIYQDNNILIKIFRDYLNEEINEILIDDYKYYLLSIKQIEKINKNKYIKKIKFYNKKIPLFSYFQIETQIESAYKREVRLPSGGLITIDITEALTSIDINSSKSKKGIDIETTALNTNLEATQEISRQLRLRDVSGLIVIDFIDMNSIKNQKIIEKSLKKSIKDDKAKIQIGYISKFGLLEMSRQRINTSLKESSHYTCPRCKGFGNIRDNESLSLLILRIIEEEAFKKDTKEIHVIVPIDISIYLINKKRYFIYLIEKKQEKKVKILIIPNKEMQTPNYSILRIKNKEKKNNYYNNKNNNNDFKKNKYIYLKKKKTNTYKKNTFINKKTNNNFKNDKNNNILKTFLYNLKNKFNNIFKKIFFKNRIHLQNKKYIKKIK